MSNPNQINHQILNALKELHAYVSAKISHADEPQLRKLLDESRNVIESAQSAQKAALIETDHAATVVANGNGESGNARYADQQPESELLRSARQIVKDIEATQPLKPDEVPNEWKRVIGDVIRNIEEQTEVIRDLQKNDENTPLFYRLCANIDNQHTHRQLSVAAACYAMNAHADPRTKKLLVESWWPWSASQWKPSTPRHDLVKAAALCAAAINQIDRDEQKGRSV